jgi:DNA polymerase-3 subunit gamma/tau
VFENILHQPVIENLKADIAGETLAPSILFSGPEYGGKGTAALELARVLGCEQKEKGKWNCPCPSCVRHRNLLSPDLLLLGKRRFFEEIAASAAAFLRQGENTGVRLLFVRSVRKLLARFNPVLWEDDPRLAKIRPHINALEEELEDFEEKVSGEPLPQDLEKNCNLIIKKASKLEVEGLGELIPIGRIRRAAYWSRLAPIGRHKCIIIENAGHMQEGAKNSLLKILEEPPPRVTILLTSSRPMSLLPTMLSRLREYHFVKRNGTAEGEVISRIFRSAPAGGEKPFSGIEAYLSSFLPVSAEKLYPLGAYFTSSAAAQAQRELQKSRREIPPFLKELELFAGPIAEQGGMGRSAADFKGTLSTVLAAADNFVIPGLLAQFFRQISALLSAWLRSNRGSPEKSACIDLWRRELNKSLVEADSFNIASPLVLEKLLETLKTGMIT